MTRRGFTLVEMLLVVFILAAVAATAVSTLDSADGQLRYDDSKARLERLREGMLGDRSPAGRLAPRGFVADVGRLPTTIEELIERPATIPAWDPVSEAGWRGPYVAVPPRQTGAAPRYPDGFGNDDGGDDHGWTLTFTPPLPATTSELTLASAGGGELAGPQLTVRADEAFVEASSHTVRVVFDVADVNAHLLGLGHELRLRLHYPQDGLDAVLESTGGGSFDPLPALGGHSALEFTFPAQSLPWGVRRLEVVTDAGAAFGSGAPARLLLQPRTSAPRFEMTWSVTP